MAKSLFQKLKEGVSDLGGKLKEDYLELIPKVSPQQSFKERLIQSISSSVEFPKRLSEGFIEGATGGLVDIPSQKTSNIFKQIPYGIGSLVGFLKTGKVLGALKLVQAITKPVIGTGLKLAKGGKIAGLLGRGIVNVGEGIPYSIMPITSKIIKKPEEAPKEAIKSTAFDLALGATPFVGGLAVSTPMPTQKAVIRSFDDLASAVFKEFKGKVGDEIGIETPELFKKLIDKGYSISKHILNKVEGVGSQKYLNFKSGLAYKEGNKIFFGFDNDFKPKAITKIIVKKPEVKSPKFQPPETKGFLPKPPEIPLLTGKVKLTPRQAVKVFKKTGEAVESTTKIKPGKNPILLPEMSEQLAGKMGKASFAPPELIKTEKDLNPINSFFAQPRRVIEDLGKGAKEFTVDFLTKSLAKGYNFQKEIVEKMKPILDEAGVRPDNKNDKLLFDFIENKVDETTIAKEFPDKLEAFKVAKGEIRKLYDDLLEKINTVRIRFGSEPVERREDYITHLVEMGKIADSVLGKNFGARFFDIHTKSLVPFFRFGEERKGATEYEKSVLKALDAYTKTATHQIYLPEAIERFRLLSNLAKDKGLSSYSHYLDEIATYLQKGMSQSQMIEKNEPLIKGIRNMVDDLSRRVSANLVSHNISASFSNFAQITTTLPTQVSPQAYFKGWLKAITSPLTEEKNFMVDSIQSIFLRLRNTPPKLYEKELEKILNKTNLFRATTEFADNVAFRAFYEDALLKGMSFEEAGKYADDMASKLVGERVFGLTPNFIRDANLFLKPFTMFTLEPVNVFYSILRDNLKMSENSAVKWATRLGLYTVFAELFNQATEKTIGRRFAFSPIDITLKSIDIMANDTFDEKEKTQEIAKVIARNIPLADIFLGKGAYGAPIFAPLPTQQELEENPALAVAKFGLVGVNPYGGGYQTYKTLEGLKAYKEGAVKTPKGEIKYPVEQDLENFLRLALFGKASVPEAREYYEKRRKPLSLKQSIILEHQPKEVEKDLYEKLMLERTIKGEIQSMKNDIVEKYYKRELTPEFVKERQDKARKAITYAVKQYKAPKGLLTRVLEYLGLIAKEEIKDKGVIIETRNEPVKEISFTNIAKPAKAPVRVSRKINMGYPRINFKIKYPQSKKKGVAYPSVKIRPLPKPNMYQLI